MGEGARASLGSGNRARERESGAGATLRPEEGYIQVSRRRCGTWVPHERGLGARVGFPVDCP